jgi:hypothetical protein
MAHGPSLGARRPRGKLRAETPVNRRSPPFYLPARDPGAAPAARKQDGNSETPAGFLGFLGDASCFRTGRARCAPASFTELGT